MRVSRFGNPIGLAALGVVLALPVFAQGRATPPATTYWVYVAHALREGRDQNTFASLDPLLDLSDQVIHLPSSGADIHFGVDQTSGANDLLNDLLSVIHFVS